MDTYEHLYKIIKNEKWNLNSNIQLDENICMNYVFVTMLLNNANISTINIINNICSKYPYLYIHTTIDAYFVLCIYEDIEYHNLSSDILSIVIGNILSLSYIHLLEFMYITIKKNINNINLDTMFVKYLKSGNSFKFEDICNYLVSLKFDINKHNHDIMLFYLKNPTIDIHIINGLWFSQEQMNIINKHLVFDDNYISFENAAVCMNVRDYAGLYALNNCSFSSSNVDVFVMNAYYTNDVVCINKNKDIHKPNFECLKASCGNNALDKINYIPDENINNAFKMHKLNIVNLGYVDCDIDVNTIITLNMPLKYISDLNIDKCTFNIFVKSCYEKLCRETCRIYIERHVSDILKYEYFQNNLFVNAFTRINEYDVFINMNDIMCYVVKCFSGYS